MIQIAPSILTCNFLHLEQDIKAAEQGGIDAIHLDVMDGVFVPNISFGPLVVAAIRKQTKLLLDVHLMIVQPEKYIQQFANAGAGMISIHYEACTHLHRTIQEIKQAGCKVGVALNPATSVSVLENVLSEIDMVVLMSVNPGFGGQAFISHTIQKIKQLKTLCGQYQKTIDIQIDGGVNATNIASIANAGATIAVVGSAIFNEKNIVENVQQIRTAAELKL